MRKPAVDNTQLMPLRQLPLYAHLDTSQYWYGLLPEIIVIQRLWIEKHLAELEIEDELKPYLRNAISLHHTALIVAGNDKAYFSLYSLRAILERVALTWTTHSSSPLTTKDVLEKLRSNNISKRVRVTQSFIELAGKYDPVFTTLYDMVSQYFAHASKMDGVALGNTSDKDKLLQMRAKVLPLFLLLDAGQRIHVLIRTLLEDQGKEANVLDGGRKPHFSYDLDRYVRICTYVACEKHSRRKGVPISTLFKNIKGIEGQVGINDIYRGGMKLIRFGNPETRPSPEEIAGFSLWAVGKGHDDKVNVKCESVEENREIYTLSWPKTLELDSTGLSMIASHGQGHEFPFFDYIDQFLKVIDQHGSTREKSAK